MKIESSKINLYAFWKYDLFPYVLAGLATRIDTSGLVYVPGYLRWFKPIFMLPVSSGVALYNKTQELRVHLDSELKRIKTKHIAMLKELDPRLIEHL